MSRVLPLVVALFLAWSVSGQQVGSLPGPGDPANYEPVLFPLVLDGEVKGARGSRWRASGTIVNIGNEDLLVAGAEEIPGSEDNILQPGEIALVSFRGSSVPGSLIWVQRDHAADFAYANRLSESSGEFNTIEIPVVTLDEGYVEKFLITYIPYIFVEHRLRLRVYDLEAVPLGKVKVVISEFPSSRPLGEVFLDLLAPGPLSSLSVEPGYTELSLEEFLRVPIPVAAPPAVQLLQVEVTPLTEGMRVWGMVSVTDWDNRVSLYTPQQGVRREESDDCDGM